MKVGDRVKIIDPDIFVRSTATKIDKGRIGVIIGFTQSPNHKPIVLFPKDGRRKEYHFGQCRDKWLEVVQETPPV